MLGGYRLVRVLGRGGLAEVFEAVAPDGRTVALKAFRMGDDEAGLGAAAFVREAHLGRRLSHPGIVPVLDAGCDGDHAFLAMEYVPGYDLRRHTARGQLLPVPQVLHVGEQVARALAAAHAVGIVHRDVKPGNVLVDTRSQAVKLTDFGLARLGDVFRSRTGVVAGTPGYMSPEQLAEGVIGPATDLYALGVMLFELLTGRLPFEAPSLGALLQQVARCQPPRVNDLRPDLPSSVATPLADLVGELLQRDADRRPADAGAVADRLAVLRAGAGAGPKSHR
jgi:serine/threonine-protein kinase